MNPANNYPPFPASVQKALGQEAAQDLESWIKRVIEEAINGLHLPVSAFVARQKINTLMLDRVSNLLMTYEAELRWPENGKPVWHVPIYMTSSSKGRIGCVGGLNVDAQTGEVKFNEADLARIASEAERLVRDFPQNKRG